MAQVINTNISSLNAQRNLNTSQSLLATSLQRLSSGLRINSAKDDAAGLAISERMTTQIRGTNQAIRNANDGISLAQTGEGALSELTQSLQRIRELAVQATNASNSESDRTALNLEVQQRLAEIDRISSQTAFNGRKILDGKFGNAAFQIGAEAGQVINLNLSSSTRLADIGKIATTTTSQALGAEGVGGSVTTALAISNFDFSGAGTADGGVTITAGSFLFGTNMDPGTSGQVEIAAGVGVADYSAAGGADGINVQSIDDFDFSGAGLAQFNLDDGTDSFQITLTADYGNLAGVAAEIQTQLQSYGAGAAYTAAVVNGQIAITATGSATAFALNSADANAVAAGFVNSAGLAGNANDDETFTVDGIAITLDANYTDLDGLATELQSQLNVTGDYTVTNDAGALTIKNNVIGSDAPVIVATNAKAFTAGWDFGDNLDAADGTPAVSSSEIQFKVDGTTITLTDDYSSFDDLVTDNVNGLQEKLDTAFAEGAYVVTNDGNSISIVKSNGTPVTITAVDDAVVAARAATAGFGPVAGAIWGQASFKVDGQLVTLNTDTTDMDGLLEAINGQLDGYTASNDAGKLKITNDTNGSAAVSITDADDNAVAAEIADATGVAGVVGGSVTLTEGQFTIAVGNGDAYDFEGEYDSVADLATAINRELSGIAASVDEAGFLKLMSTETIELGGTEATGDMSFAAATVEATSGSLSELNVLDLAASNETIVRIDSALTSVSTLRSTFGAIQNRFDSTISNLTVTAENLTSSRSRIQDTDFASETANLTRAQILQQAGVAMLAQGNALPNQVLTLLRG